VCPTADPLGSTRSSDWTKSLAPPFQWSRLDSNQGPTPLQIAISEAPRYHGGMPQACSREQPLALELAVVDHDVRVRIGGDREFALPDERADFCLRAPLPVHQRDTPVAQVVRRPRRNRERLARLRDRSAQRVGARTCEQARGRVAILARSELCLERLGELVR
jgi:hypothetical protein